MISGSLVCFSVDDFETFFFATVAGQRDPVKLATGEFQIKLEMESAAMPDISHLSDYVMIESQVYFEVCMTNDYSMNPEINFKNPSRHIVTI